VIIPLYNHERYIQEAIESVFAQTLAAYEIIIVDDGSVDDSAEVVSRLIKNRQNVVSWSKENGGAHSAINAGIRRATGDFVAILNSDDVYHPGRFAKLTKIIESDPSVDAVSTGLEFIDGTGKRIENEWYQQSVAFYRTESDLGVALVNANFLMTTSNLFIKKTTLDQIGGFCRFRYAHDLEFFLRLVATGRNLRFFDQPLLTYRMHDSNTINEGVLRVKYEWAVSTAFFLNALWDKSHTEKWHQAANFLRVLKRHNLAMPVQLCMAYFKNHPSENLEDNQFFIDSVFQDILRELVE
jgi:glycosyltransferase involved in cell wall biosynthesis